jgi:hypothetical protein
MARPFQLSGRAVARRAKVASGSAQRLRGEHFGNRCLLLVSVAIWIEDAPRQTFPFNKAAASKDRCAWRRARLTRALTLPEIGARCNRAKGSARLLHRAVARSAIPGHYCKSNQARLPRSGSSQTRTFIDLPDGAITARLRITRAHHYQDPSARPFQNRSNAAGRKSPVEGTRCRAPVSRSASQGLAPIVRQLAA